MKKSVTGLFFFAVFFQNSFIYATSYPVLEEHIRNKNRISLNSGVIVYLFHSGIPGIKKMITTGNILDVYRKDESCLIKKTGKIRIISFSGENYYKAEVVSGQIRPDDLVKTGEYHLIVILKNDECGR